MRPEKNASGQVHSRASHQGYHFIYAIFISHKWAMTIIRVVTQYEPRVQCEILALRLDQLLLWLQLILPFLLPLAFFLSLTCSFKWIPTLILILLFHLFLFSPCSTFFFVFPCTATPPPTSAHSGQSATVLAPAITSADTLMLKLSCLSLTINGQQSVHLCQSQGKKLTTKFSSFVDLCNVFLQAHTFRCSVPIWWCQRWIVRVGVAYG